MLTWAHACGVTLRLVEPCLNEHWFTSVEALALLKRHFFEYERTDEVRSKEMMEARVDAVFATIVKDPAFLTLTSGADGKLPMVHR